MTARKIFFLLLILLSQSFSPFSSWAEEKAVSINLWPLFQYASDPTEGISEINGLGPFFFWRRDSAQDQWGIRPLLYWTRDEIEPLMRLEFVYPFGKFQVKEGEKKGYLFPVSLYREEESEGKKRWDFQFFPFFMGETEKGRDYFGIFPIFGTLFERYAKDEIRFYFWPIYSESSSEGVHKTDVLWPFFSIIEGEKKRGYRFWPIYGQREEVGVSYSRFFLWPIFLKQRTGLDTDSPIEENMVFPFYAAKESKTFESRTYLWPFFSRTKERTSGFEAWDLPWPIFQSLKGENLKGIKIFPFYGYKEKKDVMKRVFILYPLYQLEEDRTDDRWEKAVRILLLSRIRIGEKTRSLRIWPFFDYEEEGDHRTLSVFYIFPFKNEGFERNLLPLFRIFHWEENPIKGISANLFWGFYKRVKREETESWEIAHLVAMKREKGVKTFSFLKGLLRFQSDGKSRNLRIFYLPFHLRWFHPHSIHQSWGGGRPAFQSLPVRGFSAKAGFREEAGGKALIIQEGQEERVILNLFERS